MLHSFYLVDPEATLLCLQSSQRHALLTRERETTGGVDAGHFEQEKRGAIHITQAHKHSCPLLPTAMAFVLCGFVLAQVPIRVGASEASPLSTRGVPS